MNKKFFITLATIFSIILFGITYSFAGNNMGEDAVEGVRNFVGGAENVIENTAKDVGEGIRSGVTDVKDAAQDTTHDMTRDNRNNNSNYSATRTSARTSSTGNSFLNMGATAWSLFIIATLGITTVALVWYYGKQNEINVHHNNNNDNNY